MEYKNDETGWIIGVFRPKKIDNSGSVEVLALLDKNKNKRKSTKE